jgi:single-strand DNA-binding protein
MLNKIIIMGRLAHTPELKHTASGTTYVQFSLAVDRDFRDKQSGEKVTDWIDLVAWGNTAEFICRYFGKGRMMVASGRLQTESYTDKQGNKRKSTKVVVENAYFGDSKPSGSTASAPVGQTTASGDDFVVIPDTVSDDDLPFI